MGNQQGQAQQIVDQFDLDEITGTQTSGIDKKNILIDTENGELVYYLVTERTVEKMKNQQNNKTRMPFFGIGQTSPPITHSLLIKQDQRCKISEENQDNKQGGALIVLIFSDNKLAVLTGDELQLLKTIQLFAPLDAFRVSLMYEMKFSIKEDSLHKQKQQELLDQLLKSRQDFQELIQNQQVVAVDENENIQQVRKSSKVQKEDEQTRKNSKAEKKENQQRKNSKVSQEVKEKEQKNEETEKVEETKQKDEKIEQDEKEKTEEKEEQEVRNKSQSVINREEQQQKYYDFMKAQYEIFVQASKMVANDLLSIQSICFCTKSVILVGYKCGLIQKVTVEKNLIDVEEECIFFNPLNLKSKAELESIVTNKQEGAVGWENLNILMLHSLFCVHSTYVIAVHQQQINQSNEANDNQQTNSSSNKQVDISSNKKASGYKTFVYVYEYQHGKKVSYFEATNHKIIKTFVNPHEDTNKSIIYILDEQNILSLYNFEKGTFLQSFTLEKSLRIIDVNYHFYRKEQMFSQIGDAYKLLENVQKIEDKSIDGDIFLYFTSDCKTLITQLDYKPSTQTVPQNNGEKAQVKKVLNQRALKILTSKIACNYKTSIYYPEQDILFIAGENGQLLRFKNFLASIYYFL